MQGAVGILFLVTICISFAPTNAVAPKVLTAAEKKQIVDTHNFIRSIVAAREGIKNLAIFEWSDTAGGIAGGYLSDNECSVRSHNRNTQGHGENLSWGPRTLNGNICNWYNEYKHWAEQHRRGACCQGSFSKYGHVSAQLWESTSKVGCGWCTSGDALYRTTLLCNYHRSGNYQGRKAYSFDLANPGGCMTDADCPPSGLSTHKYCDRSYFSDGGLCSATPNSDVGPKSPISEWSDFYSDSYNYCKSYTKAAPVAGTQSPNEGATGISGASSLRATSGFIALVMCLSFMSM